MSSEHKVYRKIHYMNLSDGAGDQVALVGKIKSIDRKNQKLTLDILGKEFDVNNFSNPQKLEINNIGRPLGSLNLQSRSAARRSPVP